MSDTGFNSSISQVSVEELANCLSQSDHPGIQLLDVREPEEVEIASLADFTNLPLSQFAQWSGQIGELLDPHAETMVICHHGVRSMQMCHWLVGQGFTNVKNIAGGIDAYSCLVDRSVPRY